MPKAHKVIAIAGALVILGSTVGGALASSHREAPLSKDYPTTDLTDLYAWRTDDDHVSLVMNVWPFEEPTGGPNFYDFADYALYDFNIDNDADARPDITFRFDFRTIVENGSTFLYNTGRVTSPEDADLAVRQEYSVTQINWDAAPANRIKRLIRNANVPSVYVGQASNGGPSTYENMATATIENLAGDIKVFAGQRDDPFALDLRVFDLLYGGNLSEVGTDTLKGFNVQSIVMEVPIETVTKGNDPVIGVWATVSAPSTTVINANGSQTHRGAYRQISRLGNPLVNEVVVPRPIKDAFNALKPRADITVPGFGGLVTDPELARLLNAVYGIDAPESNRQDLVAIFLTGFKLPDGTNVNKPRGTIRPSEQLRLNTSIEPCTADSAEDTEGACSRLGVLGGDLAGWPNGRRLTDDVVDIAIKAVAGVTYKIFVDPAFDDTTAQTLGDGVDRNDKAFRNSFPYLASPHSGSNHVHHGRGRAA